MKRTMTIAIAGLLALSLTACGQPAAPEGPTVEDVQAQKTQLEQQLADRDAQIDDLTGQVEEQAGRITDLSEKLEKAQAALQTAQAALEEATAEPEEPALPESGSQPQTQSPAPEKAAPAPATSSAPTATTNADGSRSLTISFGGEIESGTTGSTREEAESLLAYLREYAESVGMEWTADAKDGGFEPAIEVSSKDVEAGIRSRIDRLKDAGCDAVYGELQKDDRNPDEWNIILYR
ncbi:hypothetical protein [Anaerotruncus rubiinfantis]|uniref:hypothetical protein n=1 Tax=Anaerotruncus rubiinfantis TaxID=1720200 RepID=UPI0034A38092